MARALRLHETTVGKKAVLAVTGFALFGFLIVHLIGNLQVFLGPEAGATALHVYAAGLRKLGPLLWVARFVLLLAIGGHIWAAVGLANRNDTARPEPYRKKKSLVTTYAARTMLLSGPIIGLYVIYHIWHLTLGNSPAFDPQNVYNNVVLSFTLSEEGLGASGGALVRGGSYILANLLLGMHLFHGGWSWLQSLGMSHPRYNHLRKIFAIALAAFLTIGNVAIPLSCMAGWVEPADPAWFQQNHCSPELGDCGDNPSPAAQE